MKQKKRHKMMFGLWLGFMGLAGAMALLFWMVLHFSVKNKYQEQTENDLKWQHSLSGICMEMRILRRISHFWQSRMIICADRVGKFDAGGLFC